MATEGSRGRIVFSIVTVVIAGFVFGGPLLGPIDGGAQEDPRFVDATNASGISYVGITEQPGVRGDVSNSGVYAADYDQDHRSDVLLVGGDEPVLFRNAGGSFERIRSFSTTAGYVRTALWLDYDGNGWQDLILFPHNGTPIVFENTAGNFTRAQAGFDRRISVPIGAAAADFDRDGCLDLFVIQNGDWIEDKPARLVGRMSEMGHGNGRENILYQGSCGSFERVTGSGIAEQHWSLATSFVDLTGDGYPDIHVANDFNYDALYVNEGDGTFRRSELNNTNRNAMSSEIVDINQDGRPDIFVTNIQWSDQAKEALGQIGYATGGYEGNNLLVNQGDGEFADQAPTYGVMAGRWGWAAVIADLDNDRDRDIFHTTRGHFLDDNPFIDRSKLRPFRYPRFFERTSQESFTARDAADSGFDPLDGRGTSRLDYDGDGDLDLLVANATGRFRLYENQLATGNALRVRVLGKTGTPARGARVEVRVNGTVRTRMVHGRTDFLSQEPRTLHFGLGDRERVASIRVIRPDGTVRTFHDVAAGQLLVVGPDKTVKCDHDGTGCHSK